MMYIIQSSRTDGTKPQLFLGYINACNDYYIHREEISYFRTKNIKEKTKTKKGHDLKS